MKLFSDNPKNNDELGFTSMAEILDEVIRDTQPPFTIGVFGEWGSGKTTLMNMVRQCLHARNVKTVWFNAWKYDRKEIIWNALIQTILYSIRNDSALNDRKDGVELKERVKTIAENLARYAAKVATRLIPGGVVKEEDVDSLIATFLPLSANDAQFEFINDFEIRFDLLVKQYVGENQVLVVFIDDLDRCLPENAINVLEALKLYLDRTGCIFIFGAERSIVEEGIRQRYKDNVRLSAKEYLEKIVQLPFIMRGVAPENALSLLDPHDQTVSLRSNAILCQLIIEGTQGNPRRIKRFLNAFLILKKISGELGEDEHCRLAKILMIQMRFPSFYDALSKDLDLITYFSDVLQMTSQERERIINSNKSLDSFYQDAQLRNFLDKTRNVSCLRDQIVRWILLTKETPPTDLDGLRPR